jgi:hypothetical protein
MVVTAAAVDYTALCGGVAAAADVSRMTEQVPVLACDKPLNLHSTPIMI